MLVAWPYNIGFLAQALLEHGDATEAARVIDEGDLPVDQVHLAWFRLDRDRCASRPEAPNVELRSCSSLARNGTTRWSEPPSPPLILTLSVTWCATAAQCASIGYGRAAR